MTNGHKTKMFSLIYFPQSNSFFAFVCISLILSFVLVTDFLSAIPQRVCTIAIILIYIVLILFSLIKILDTAMYFYYSFYHISVYLYEGNVVRISFYIGLLFYFGEN